MTIRARRFLARLYSPGTMARLVDPVLADMRFEGRATWRGYVTLARALALHAVMSLPAHLTRAWNDDGHALARAMTACAMTTLVLVAPFVAIPANSALRISWRAVILLLPQALAVALPASLLVAIPVAFRRTPKARHVVIRGLALSAICAAATSLVIIDAIPDANQAFRIEVMKMIAPHELHLQPGPVEMTLHQLREQIDALRLTPGGAPAARRLEYTYQFKLALCTIALPLGFLAIAITVSARGRWGPLLAGMGCTIGYVVSMFALDDRAIRLMARSATIPPAAVAWIPPAAIAAAGAAILLRAERRRRDPWWV